MKKWRSFVVAAVTAVSLGVCGSATPASAVSITGQFSMTGADTYDLALNTIAFVPGSTTVTPGTTSGSFVGLDGSAITWLQGLGVPVDYTTLTGPLFSGISGLTFTLTGIASFNEGGIEPSSLEIVGFGIMTLTGFDATPGTFSLTTQKGGTGLPPAVSFSATVGVPGPIVGAGLPALVFACGALIALARRRRNYVTA